MSFPIISADKRLNEQRGIKGCIIDKLGIGNSSLLWIPSEVKTLFTGLGMVNALRAAISDKKKAQLPSGGVTI